MSISSLNTENCHINKNIDQNIKKDTSVETSVFEDENDLSKQVASLNQELKEAKDKQGGFGTVWNNIKNLTGAGLSTNDLNEEIEKFKNGETSYDEVLESIENFEKKQDCVVNIFSNILTSTIAGAAITVCAASGGILAGLAVGALVGGATNASFKILERTTNNIEGDAFDKKKIMEDTLFGSINGLATGITAGLCTKINPATTWTKTSALTTAEGSMYGALSSGISSGVSSAGNYIVSSKVNNQTLRADELLETAGKNICTGMLVGAATKGMTSNLQYSIASNDPFDYYDKTALIENSGDLLESIQLEIQGAVQDNN